MRTLCSCTALIIANAASAQLVNGSFEVNDLPSLEGWEWTCAEPITFNLGAPGFGSWSALKLPGQTQGCFPSYIYQRIPDAVNGEILTLTGWVGCTDGGPCAAANIGFGRISNGLFALEGQAGSTTGLFTFVSVTDTMEIGSGDTAIVVLNPGLISFPPQGDIAGFDGIQLVGPLGVDEPSREMASAYYDRAENRIYISALIAVQTTHLLDITGRMISPSVERFSATTLRIDASGLPPGVYFANLLTASGQYTIRFLVDGY